MLLPRGCHLESQHVHNSKTNILVKYVSLTIMHVFLEETRGYNKTTIKAEHQMLTGQTRLTGILIKLESTEHHPLNASQYLNILSLVSQLGSFC